FLLANMVVVIIVWSSLRQSRGNYEARARDTAENMSLLLSENIAGMIQRVHLGLLSIKDIIELTAAQGALPNNDIGDVMERQQKRMPELNALRFADEN